MLLGKLVNYPFTSANFSTNGFSTLTVSVGAGDNPQHVTGVSVQREENGTFVERARIPCDGGAQCTLQTVPVLGGNYRLFLEGNGTGAVLAGILRTSHCSAPTSGTQPIVEDNFNGYTDGSIVGQDGWVSYVNGDHFVVQGDTVFEGAKAVHNNSFGDSVAGRYGTQRADGKQTVCFRTENRDNWGFYSADGNAGVRVSDGFNGTIFASVSLKKDGHVAYYDPIADVYSDFATYNDNEWTLLEIEWRSSDKTARYRVNSGAWTDWKTFRGAASFTKFDFVHFGFVLPSGSGGVYFDTLR